jgi:hypothetical protein
MLRAYRMSDKKLLTLDDIWEERTVLMKDGTPKPNSSAVMDMTTNNSSKVTPRCLCMGPNCGGALWQFV